MPNLNRLAALFIFSSCILLSDTTSEELDSLKSATERWIDVRNRLSKEQAEWKTEKSMLASTIDTLEATKQSLSEKVDLLEIESAKLTGESDTANVKLEDLLTTDSLVLEKVSEVEKRILDIAKRLPQPLIDKIAPLLRKIPTTESTSVSATNRLQNAVAIATQIDEFNNNLTLAHTIRSIDNGDAIEVRVLYWGIATAFAVSSDGSKAWILSPSEDSWVWQVANEESPAIKNLFAVYDKTIDPTMVSVPISFSDSEIAN